MNGHSAGRDSRSSTREDDEDEVEAAMVAEDVEEVETDFPQVCASGTGLQSDAEAAW